MKSSAVFVVVCLLLQATAKSEQPELKTIQARSLELKVPATWVKKEAASSMRVAQFSIPGDAGDADLVVFYFGGPTGGVKANVERWIGQFDKEGLQLKMTQGKCNAGSYILVDTAGTWNKPDGPPFAQKTVATPNSRVLNVIVIEEKEDAKDYYFIKLSGQKDVVGGQAKALRTAIGADAESEKPFELKDAK